MRYSSSNLRNGSTENNVRLLCPRLTLLFLVMAISILSIYFNHYALLSLRNKVHSNAEIIGSLEGQVNLQKSIIDKFNNSITSAELEHHVEVLGQSLYKMEDGMKQDLNNSVLNIESLSNQTVGELDEIVKLAQADIQSEVDLVKSDAAKYAQTTKDQFSTEKSFMKFQLAGTFCLLAILISMWHMTAHIRQFNHPFVQRKILAILWMSPIYAITSWLSLVFPKFEGYLSIIKDFYEAYVIYQFLGFCISVLGRDHSNEKESGKNGHDNNDGHEGQNRGREYVVELLAKHADHLHLDPPLRFCGCFRGTYHYKSPRALANAVLLQCQIFAMQFVFLTPLTSVGLFVCHNYDVCTIHDVSTSTGGSSSHGILFGIPIQSLENPILWLRIVQNISVFLAFHGLLKFYHAVQEDLIWCNPFPKFLCIKGIVFMTFWQGLVISFLANNTNIAGVNIHQNLGSDASPSEIRDAWGKQTQNFLICLEMLLFSIAHFYCFPTDEWQDGYRPTIEKKIKGFGDNMAFGDFVADLKLIMRGDDTKMKQTKKRKDKTKSIEEDVLTITDDNSSNSHIISNDTVKKASVDVEEGLIKSSSNNFNEVIDNEGINDNKGNDQINIDNNTGDINGNDAAKKASADMEEGLIKGNSNKANEGIDNEGINNKKGNDHINMEKNTGDINNNNAGNKANVDMVEKLITNDNDDDGGGISNKDNIDNDNVCINDNKGNDHINTENNTSAKNEKGEDKDIGGDDIDDDNNNDDGGDDDIADDDYSMDEATMDSFLTSSIRQRLSSRKKEVRNEGHKLLRTRMITFDNSERSVARSSSRGSAVSGISGIGSQSQIK